MSLSATREESRRPRFRKRLSHIRQLFRSPSRSSIVDTNRLGQESPSNVAANRTGVPTPVVSPPSKVSATSRPDSRSHDDTVAGTQIRSRNSVATGQPGKHQQSSSDAHTIPQTAIGVTSVTTDLWSAAYREAVDGIGRDINVAILQGENVAHLFAQLEKVDKDATGESLFLRGVKFLHSVQVPLEKIKLALDITAPLTNVEPTAATVFGVLRSVTAIAISLATADRDFAKQIGEMLEQLSYIDDCDTLGQKARQEDIHNTLVLVYRKLLEFYDAAYEILTKRGRTLMRSMILEQDRLSEIVTEFSRYAEQLHKLIQKATLEIVEDIRAMLYDHKISTWLGSEKMRRLAGTHSSLRELSADEACNFLLKKTKFIDWYSASDSRQLALLGDMGSGKSVAMSFLINELHVRSKQQLPQPKIWYHYCQDNETGEAIYVVSVMILSLLEQFEGLKRTFFNWYKETEASGDFEPAANFRRLEDFLHTSVATLDRPLCILLDGLDECERASRNLLIESLNALSQKSSRLKILLSCRAEQEILEQLDGIPHIYLTKNMERDRIIAARTVERRLSYLKDTVKKLTIEKLTLLAQGSAIWTKMVVELIGVRRITALEPMRAFLDDVPQPTQLSKLYGTILSRYTSDEPENRKLATTALEILTVARRPLSILELTWTVTLASAPESVNTVSALAKLADPERIMNLVRPFTARVRFEDLGKRQVTLVHQSVREYVVCQSTWTPPAGGKGSLKSLRIQSLEKSILDICMRYLLLEEVGHIELFSEEQQAIEELPQEYDLFDNENDTTQYDVTCTWEVWEEGMIRFNPSERGLGELFTYASCNWVEHLGAITSEPLPLIADVERLCCAGSVRLRNWTKQNCRPECAIRPRVPFDSSLFDPLSIVSLYGSEKMLRHVLENSDFDSHHYLPNPAVGAAYQLFDCGEIARLSMLFADIRIGRQLQNLSFFELLMDRWLYFKKRHQSWDNVFDLVHKALDVSIKEGWGNELLCIAANKGCMPLIQRLFDNSHHRPDSMNALLHQPRCEPQDTTLRRPSHQSVGEAVFGNHVGIVEYLVEQPGIEEHLRFRNSNDENVLHLASTLCNPAMFQVLLPRFHEGIHQMDKQGRTVFTRIIMSSAAATERFRSARIVLLGKRNHEIDVDDTSVRMYLAELLGDVAMRDPPLSTGKQVPSQALILDSHS